MSSAGATGRLGLVLFGVMAGAACLAAAELALRLVGAGEGAPGYDPFSGFSAAVPLFEPAAREDGTSIYRVSPARLDHSRAGRVDSRGREFLAEKPSEGFRIFVVGGSSAAGFPYGPNLAFSGVLERWLRPSLPGLTIEVVNAAVAGYSSRRVLITVREIAAHEPDLLIVYSGHNEWAERRYYSRLIDMDPRLFRLREGLFSTRLFTVLSRLRPSGRPDAGEALTRLMEDERREFVEMFAVFSDRADGRSYATPGEIEQRDQLYHINLVEIVEAARGAGAQVLLMSLSQNFSDWRPGASGHREDLSETQANDWQRLLESGRQARSRGDCAAALRHFDRALSIDADHAQLHFEIAGCHRSGGDEIEAWRHYRRASDLDRIPHGAPTYFNDLLHELAEQNELLWLDVDDLLRRDSGPGLVGNDLFVEFAHPNLRAHQLIAGALVTTLRASELPRPAHEWVEEAIPDPDPERLYAANPELRAREQEAIRFVCALARRPDCEVGQE